MIERVAAWLMWTDESIRTVERGRAEARAIFEIADGTAPLPEPAATLWAHMLEIKQTFTVNHPWRCNGCGSTGSINAMSNIPTSHVYQRMVEAHDDLRPNCTAYTGRNVIPAAQV
jgi:hypothetical protein